MSRRHIPGVLRELLSAGLALVLSFGLTYLLGSKMLLGNLQGNDSPLHLAYATWLNQYFPRIPNWYPLQGAGISLVHGYPVLSHELVVVLHRISGLSLMQAFRLLSFLSMPASAFGIYLFGRVVMRRSTAGWLAEALFLLSPISWTWVYNWGFFAQQIAFIGVPFALVAFDRAWEATAYPRDNGSRRLWLVGVCVILVLTSLSHLLVGFAAAAAMGLYVFFSTAVVAKGGRRLTLSSGLKVLLFAGIVVGLVAAVYLVPFYHYGSFANREGLNTPTEEQLHRLPLATFFGLEPIDPLEILTRMQFPLAVSVAGMIGLLAATRIDRRRDQLNCKPLAIALTTVFCVFFALVPALPAIVLRFSSTLFFFMNFRSMLVVAMVLLPAIGAFGLCRAGDLIRIPLRMFVPKSNEESNRAGAARVLGATSSSGLATLLAAFGLLLMASPASGQADHLPYGPETNGIDLADIWGRGDDSRPVAPLLQLSPSQWPSFDIHNDDSLTSTSQRLASLVQTDQSPRIDISPYEGRLAMDLATFANASQINTYTYTASLFHRMWGYQQNVFFSYESEAQEYGNPDSLRNAAAWFGTNSVFISRSKDPAETYDAAGWEVAYSDQELELRINPDPKPLAEFTDRPVFLVVSKPETDGYMNIFRLANDGLLEFGDALLVEGGPRIDKYSVEELRQFDALFLYGYDYQDSERAWETLRDYVSGGGHLFVDTGWEYWIPEWEFKVAPEVLPVNRLSWTSYGSDPSYQILSPDIVGEVDPLALKPLEWEGQPWTVSGAPAAEVRSWGRVVLAADSNPLIVAGEFGAGKVVWSGMNLLAHAQYQGVNEEEFKLIHGLLQWLAPNPTGGSPVEVEYTRAFPDQVSFSIISAEPTSGWLYWRESEYPRWHARAGSTELPIYRAGPGFMLMPVNLKTGTTTVELGWVPSWDERAAGFATAAGIMLLVASLLDGLFLQGKGLTWLKIALITRVPKPFLGDEVSKEWVERKRRQIQNGEFSHEPRRYAPNEAVPWMRPEADAPSLADVSIEAPAPSRTGNSDSHPITLDSTAGPPPSRRGSDQLGSLLDQDQILQSWLEDTGHKDDDWATKLLGGKSKTDRS